MKTSRKKKRCLGKIDECFGLGMCNFCDSRKKCEKIVEAKERRLELKEIREEEIEKNNFIYCAGCERKLVKKSNTHKRCKPCQTTHKRLMYAKWREEHTDHRTCEYCGRDYYNHNHRFCKRECYINNRNL